ncbi:PP2C family protein-serine/threonine phosphatase [Paenarthrobacter nicotinovorans]|jgi:protein phosphatase|uniref:PP2C family protein-serine/threonine phosphatase n=1 Tax=Paenarthrobacter nicotinovorans TaxID=29320 RepID=UPI001663CCAD|nr:protein phosphatase 2C domain-containing protein [Paenarthrobacter nicotinovorans]MBP2393243.1 protein phosphatase [Paenarthrobacter nicotinovorans]UKF00489.1 protein phosphatase 2C domain-containing protein [Paenarthrobacter nicotinovorans]UKF05271.1 protein phosphatase 2C domain-containing protein [Paenarthrobacter nicotinovorans]GGV31306.1 serine/threonine protein phosphatase [Paenarthrobacter nicotinovorans]
MNSQPATPANADAGPAAGGTSFRLSYGYGTDRGLRRELNEDSFIAADPVFAVADGMGGHEAGEIASGMCVRTLGSAPELASGVRTASAADLQACLLKADAAIRDATGARAGTTLSGVVVVEQMGLPYWLVMNIGDSRTYRLSQGEFAQISVDHSEVQELVDSGDITSEQAAVHPRRHVVTRALGTGDETEADFWLLPIQEGDRIMVCSDGLNGELSDDHMFRILSTVAHPQDAVDALIQAALRSGGRDNVTVIVVDAKNVLNDAGIAITAPRPEVGSEVEEDTLPKAWVNGIGQNDQEEGSDGKQ